MGNVIYQDSSRSEPDTRSTRGWQRFYLERLQHMVATRREQAKLLETGGPDLRLLDRSVYSTYCECLDLGVGDEARSLLRQEDSSIRGTESHQDDPNQATS